MAPPAPLHEDMGALWMLGSDVTFLNHGSFGARPTAVHEHQEALRRQVERQPIQSIDADMVELMPSIRSSLASFLGTVPERLDLVANASEAVNSILRSLELSPGDELLVPDHVYGAVHQTLRYVAHRTGATVKVVHIPVPVQDSQQLVKLVQNAMTDRTRLLLVDHVTSPTAIRFPVRDLAAVARARGIDVLVDGAHGPGMLDLDVDSIGATWYIGNLHKWVCAPIGAAFIVTDPGRIDTLHPAIISHGYQQGHVEEFNWQGTRDYTPWRSIPFVLDWIQREWGWDAMRRHNHQMASWAHAMLCEAWEVEPISPLDASLLGSMATLALPESIRASYQQLGPLHDHLRDEHGIEVPIMEWDGRLWIRVSAQLYNRPEDYRRLADVVRTMAG